MQALSKEGLLLDEAKQKAAEIANAFPPSAQFQLLTNDFSGVQQRIINRDDFLSNLDKIKISTQSHSINEILKRQQDFFSNASQGNRLNFVVSDFQETMFGDKAETDSTMQLTLVPLAANKGNNVFIDSCWLASPVVQLNQQTELSIRVKNSGADAAENVPLKLSINGFQKSVTTVSVPAEGESVAQINFTTTQAGWQRGEISITDNPVTFDDTWYFSFAVAEKINVYHISHQKPNEYIKTLYNNNPVTAFTYTSDNAIDYTSLKNSNLVVLSNMQDISTGLGSELKKFCSEGGSAVIFPDTVINQGWKNFFATMGIESWGTMVTNANNVKRFERNDELFKDVFEKIADNISLPAVSSYYSIADYSRSKREVLISLEDGSPLLCRFRTGKGSVYLFMIPANESWSNFVTHALFVPVMTRAALLSMQNVKLAYTLGSNEGISLKNVSAAGESSMHLKNTKLAVDIIPEMRNSPEGMTLFIGDAAQQAGSFNLIGNDSIISVISLNYNRSESVMKFYGTDKLPQQFNSSLYKSFKIIDTSVPNLTKTITEESKGVSLWKYCIILVLLFLFTEILLLRFMN